MIVQIFFLTLFTVSNCRPSADPVDHCKGFPGMIWNGTNCICDPVDVLVKFDEGSGTSESVDSDDLSDKSLFDMCRPGDDCDASLPSDPLTKVVFDEGSGASESVDSDDSSDKSLFDECRPGDDCDGRSPPKPRIGDRLFNTSCTAGDPSGCCCSNHISNNTINITVFDSKDTNVVVFGPGLNSCCCSNEILNNVINLNITSSSGTNYTLFDFKPCGSDKCCCSMKKSTD